MINFTKLTYEEFSQHEIFRGYRNAEAIYLAQLGNGDIVVIGAYTGCFVPFYSGHIYFGGVEQTDWHNGTAIGTNGMLDIILSPRDGSQSAFRIDSTLLQPMSRTVAASRSEDAAARRTVIANLRNAVRKAMQFAARQNLNTGGAREDQTNGQPTTNITKEIAAHIID